MLKKDRKDTKWILTFLISILIILKKLAAFLLMQPVFSVKLQPLHLFFICIHSNICPISDTLNV